MKFVRKVTKFIKDVAIAAKDKVVEFVKGLDHHTEATIILVLSAIGLNALVGEVPFIYMTPMWVEAAMVIPVLSVIAILLLLRSAEWRANRRSLKVA